MLGVRGTLLPETIQAAGRAIADLLIEEPELHDARTVAAYAAAGTEPPTEPLLDALLARRLRVLLPVLRDDDDLDWVDYTGPGALTVGRHGIPQPRGESHGLEAIALCDVVVCPGLAAGPGGTRLGQGGGSYDRALARSRPQSWTCMLLYDGEIRDELPRADHDRSVDAVVTPSGVHRF